ncbi:MAG: hypothetical protein Q4G68_14420 [Planctomycetia bacterium]|nr:hypothetical protein [Planctomycetia bacterium]
MLTCNKYTMIVSSICLIVALCSGCNPNKPITVTGEVTVNGKPAEFGSIQFEAADGLVASGGGVIKNGQYTATVQPGEKIVRFTCGETTGTAMQPDSMGKLTERPVTQSLLPPDKFQKDSTIRVTIGPRARSHNFNLEVSQDDQVNIDKERKNLEKKKMPPNWHSSSPR